MQYTSVLLMRYTWNIKPEFGQDSYVVVGVPPRAVYSCCGDVVYWYWATVTWWLKNTTLCYGQGKLNQAYPTQYMNTCLEFEGSVDLKVNLSELWL